MPLKSLLRKIRKLFGVIFSVSGLVCLILSGAFAVHMEHFLLHAVSRKGTRRSR